MKRGKLVGIIAACVVAIIVVIVIVAPTPTYMLDVSVSPSGAGSVSPAGGQYKSGVEVMLTASPVSGYIFDHWGGDASGTTSTTTTIMDSDKSVTAYFVEPATPIEVVDKVKVGMTRAQVEEVVDVDYFQDNRSYRALMISDVEITDKGFEFTVAEDQWVVSPYCGDFFFSVTSDIDVALVVFIYHETDEAQDVVYAVGVIPFARAKAIVCEDGWRLRD